MAIERRRVIFGGAAAILGAGAAIDAITNQPSEIIYKVITGEATPPDSRPYVAATPDEVDDAKKTIADAAKDIQEKQAARATLTPVSDEVKAAAKVVAQDPIAISEHIVAKHKTEVEQALVTGEAIPTMTPDQRTAAQILETEAQRSSTVTRRRITRRSVDLVTAAVAGIFAYKAVRG